MPRNERSCGSYETAHARQKYGSEQVIPYERKGACLNLERNEDQSDYGKRTSTQRSIQKALPSREPTVNNDLDLMEVLRRKSVIASHGKRGFGEQGIWHWIKIMVLS